jgi:hypothetical protein
MTKVLHFGTMASRASQRQQAKSGLQEGALQHPTTALVNEQAPN